LLDVSMPVMGGMEVLREVMNLDPHPNVIMMTAVTDREIARQAMKIGAFDYIVKPFDFRVIEASITACLSHIEYSKQPWWKRLTGR
jgi:DNA-binding NtrC family response regulator